MFFLKCNFSKGKHIVIQSHVFAGNEGKTLLKLKN